MSAVRDTHASVPGRAAAQCSDIDEVIAYSERGRTPISSRHLVRAVRPLRHRRLTHSRELDQGADRPTTDEVRPAIVASDSIAGRPAAPEHGPVQRHERMRCVSGVAEDGLATAHFLGQAHQRGRLGPTPVKRAADILVQHDGKRRTRTDLLRRALHEVGVPKSAARVRDRPRVAGKPMTWRSTTSTGTGATTAARTCGYCAPTATRSPAPGAEAGTRRDSAHRPVAVGLRRRPCRNWQAERRLGPWACPCGFESHRAAHCEGPAAPLDGRAVRTSVSPTAPAPPAPAPGTPCPGG